MRILQLCKKFPFPAKDGETIAIFQIIRGLKQLGHDVTVLGMSSPKHPYNHHELPFEVEKMAKFDSIYVDTKVTVPGALANLFTTSSYNITRFYSQDYQRRLENLLRYNEYDIVQLEGLYLAQYLPTIKKYSKAPIVLRAHNVEYEIWQRLAEELPLGPKKLYFKFLAKRLRHFELKMVNEFDALVSISSKDEAHFSEKGFIGPKMTLPATIDLADFPNDSSQTDFDSVFFLGGLDWIPNQEGLKWFLREVWPQIHRRFPQVQFTIAGRHAPDWMQEDLPEKVEFLGEVESAPAYMNSKGIMIVPLFSGSGMRIKIIEAMAASKAIVATRVAAEGINYSDGQNILIADTASEFVEQICRCLESHTLLKSIGNEARSFVANQHDNLTLLEALIDFYRNDVIRIKHSFDQFS